MNLSEFLSHDSLQLPVESTSYDFVEFVRGRLASYRELLNKLDAPAIKAKLDSSSEFVDAFCDAGPRIICSIFKGRPSVGYDTFAKAIEPLRSVFEKLVHRTFSHAKPNEFFYRIRSEWNGALTRQEMFHVPFEKRERVATQRYSLPGLPCLYLGGSIYTCWAEARRPSFHEIYASAFWLAPGKTASIVDLSYRPKRLQLFVNSDGTVKGDPSNGDLQYNEELVATQIALWPLTFLCSIKAMNPKASFKPEYIVPQILLQWIMQTQDYDGIIYASTHVNEAADENRIPVCNFVFPSREISAEGYCSRLSEMFQLTEPVNCQLIRNINAGEGMPEAAIPPYMFEFIRGRPERYSATEFGVVEARLNKLALGDKQNGGRGIR